MTTLRTAAQQVLEALKMMLDEYGEANCPACDHADAAIYALRAALAEDAMQKFTDVNQELEAALAEPVQEPVAGRAFLERILAAMEGVIDVADRKTDEFDALRSCVIDLTLMLRTAPQPAQAEPVQEPVAWLHVPYPGNAISPMLSLSKHREPSMYAVSVPLFFKEHL